MNVSIIISTIRLSGGKQEKEEEGLAHIVRWGKNKAHPQSKRRKRRLIDTKGGGRLVSAVACTKPTLGLPARTAEYEVERALLTAGAHRAPISTDRRRS